MLLDNNDTISKISRFNTAQSPILIVCYTNHALDQLLLLISKFLNGVRHIVRVGSRSKEECLEACSLHALKKNFRIFGHSGDARRTVKQKIECINNLVSQLNSVDQKIHSFSELEQYFPKHLLNPLLNKEVQSFYGRYNSKIFENWLGIGGEQEENKVNYSNAQDVKAEEKDETKDEDKEMSNQNLEEAEIINQAREIEDDDESKRNIRNLFSKNNLAKPVEDKTSVKDENNNNSAGWLISRREKEKRIRQLTNQKCQPMDKNEAEFDSKCLETQSISASTILSILD